MKKLQRATVLVSLVESLRENESWCGETNIQKAVFFLQDLFGVPLEFDFVLYKYGPFSFELSEELTSLRADAFLDIEIRDSRYGPSYALGKMHAFLFEKFPKTRNRFRNQIDFVSSRLGNKRVPELEQLATALYVRLQKGESLSVDERAEKVTRLKPHIAIPDAKSAVEEVDKMFSEFSAIKV